MKKKVYEAPLFEALRVELEQGFMKASVVDKEKSNSEVTAGSQTISEEFDFTGNKWQ